MTPKRKKRGTLGTIQEEIKDVLVAIKQKERKAWKTENKARQQNARDFSREIGSPKPKWTTLTWSYQRAPLMLMRGYYSNFFAVRVRTRKTPDPKDLRRKRTKYMLQLYDRTTHSLR